MATTAGTGYSENPKSEEAGVEAARAALAEAGAGSCDLAILYSTPKHDPARLRDGIRAVIGPSARLIGGYAMGIITRDRLGYGGCQMGVAVVSSDTVKVDTFIEEGLPDNEYEVGRALGLQIKSRTYAGQPNLLLMYDAIRKRTATGLAINLATPILEGMGQSLGSWPPGAGVGMLGDLQWNPTYQWFDDRIEQGSAMALVLSGSARMDTIIMHGCRPSSDYHSVTRADGNTVLEIDGKPALQFVGDFFGPEADRSWEEYPLFVTLGVNKADKFDEFKEENYAARMCMDIDRERGGLIMFDPDLQEGSEFQFMRREIDFESMRQRTQTFLQGIDKRQCFLALYFDCAGRTAEYSGMEREEAEVIQEVIGSEMPLLGVYSGVEIGEVKGKIEPLDWSGVLCVLSG